MSSRRGRSALSSGPAGRKCRIERLEDRQLLAADSTSSLLDRVAHHLAEAPGRDGAAIVNLTTGESLSINGADVFGASSMIKLGILYALLRRVDADPGVSLTTEINSGTQIGSNQPDEDDFDNKVVSLDGISSLETNEDYTLRDLARAMIENSNNWASNLLINYLTDDFTIDFINEQFAALDLMNTRIDRYFTGRNSPPLHGITDSDDSDGLDASNEVYEAGHDNESTPLEMVSLLRQIHENDGLLSTASYNAFWEIMGLNNSRSDANPDVNGDPDSLISGLYKNSLFTKTAIENDWDELLDVAAKDGNNLWLRPAGGFLDDDGNVIDGLGNHVQVSTAGRLTMVNGNLVFYALFADEAEFASGANQGETNANELAVRREIATALGGVGFEIAVEWAAPPVSRTPLDAQLDDGRVIRIRGDKASSPEDSIEVKGSSDSDYDVTINNVQVYGQKVKVDIIKVAAGLGNDEIAIYRDFTQLSSFVVDGQAGADSLFVSFEGPEIVVTNDSVQNETIGLITLASIESLALAGDDFDNHFVVKSFLGSLQLSGGEGDNVFTIGEGDLASVPSVTIRGGDDSDRVVLNDSLSTADIEYEILAESPSRPGEDFGRLVRLGGAAATVHFLGSTEQLVLDAGAGSNTFYVTPSSDTEFVINGGDPVRPLPPGVKGDRLEIEFSEVRDPKLFFTDQAAGNGRWEFANAEDVAFTSIETFNFFDILAMAADVGALGQPLIHVINADSGDEVSPPFLAYSATYLQGVRVAVGDMNGDGIPEVIAAPGRSHASVVKVFDILTGAELAEYRTQAYADDFQGGVMIAVGDVNADGLNDIVTVPSRGPADVKVFLNQTGEADPLADAPYRWFYAFPTSFIGGASVALGQINEATPELEIVVGSGSGMRATVNVFDVTALAAATQPLAAPPVFRQYLPFEASFRGGVNVAVGNAIGDSEADVFVGAGQSGQGRIQILDGRFAGEPTPANSRTAQLFTDSGFNAHVRIALADQNGDGVAEILAAQSADGRSGNRIMRFNPVDMVIDEFYQQSDARFTGMFLASTPLLQAVPVPPVMLLPGLTADLDLDADVDGHDFLQWQRGPAVSLAAPRETESPPESSAEVLAEWRATFGQTDLAAQHVALDAAYAYYSLYLAPESPTFRPFGKARLRAK